MLLTLGFIKHERIFFFFFFSSTSRSSSELSFIDFTPNWRVVLIVLENGHTFIGVNVCTVCLKAKHAEPEYTQHIEPVHGSLS